MLRAQHHGCLHLRAPAHTTLAAQGGPSQRAPLCSLSRRRYGRRHTPLRSSNGPVQATVHGSQGNQQQEQEAAATAAVAPPPAQQADMMAAMMQQMQQVTQLLQMTQQQNSLLAARLDQLQQQVSATATPAISAATAPVDQLQQQVSAAAPGAAATAPPAAVATAPAEQQQVIAAASPAATAPAAAAATAPVDGATATSAFANPTAAASGLAKQQHQSQPNSTAAPSPAEAAGAAEQSTAPVNPVNAVNPVNKDAQVYLDADELVVKAVEAVEAGDEGPLLLLEGLQGFFAYEQQQEQQQQLAGYPGLVQELQQQSDAALLEAAAAAEARGAGAGGAGGAGSRQEWEQEQQALLVSIGKEQPSTDKPSTNITTPATAAVAADPSSSSSSIPSGVASTAAATTSGSAPAADAAPVPPPAPAATAAPPPTSQTTAGQTSQPTVDQQLESLLQVELQQQQQQQQQATGASTAAPSSGSAAAAGAGQESSLVAAAAAAGAGQESSLVAAAVAASLGNRGRRLQQQQQQQERNEQQQQQQKEATGKRQPPKQQQQERKQQQQQEWKPQQQRQQEERKPRQQRQPVAASAGGGAASVQLLEQLRELQQLNAAVAQVLSASSSSSSSTATTTTSSSISGTTSTTTPSSSSKGVQPTANTSSNGSSSSEGPSNGARQEAGATAAAGSGGVAARPTAPAGGVASAIAAAAAAALEQVSRTSTSAAPAAPASQQADSSRRSTMVKPRSTPSQTTPGTKEPQSAQPAGEGQSQPSGQVKGQSQLRSAKAMQSEDKLLLRISKTGDWQQLQRLYETNQRLRPIHIGALMARLPSTREGRAIVAAVAAAAPGAPSTGVDQSTGLVKFATDLLLVLQLQMRRLAPADLVAVAQAAAELGITPKDVWVRSFTSTTLPLLPSLTGGQLAAAAQAVAYWAEAAGKLPWAPWVNGWVDCCSKQMAVVAETPTAPAVVGLGQLAVAGVKLGAATATATAEQPSEGAAAAGEDIGSSSSTTGPTLGQTWSTQLLTTVSKVAAAAAAPAEAVPADAESATASTDATASDNSSSPDASDEEVQDSQSAAKSKAQVKAPLFANGTTAASLCWALSRLAWSDGAGQSGQPSHRTVAGAAVAQLAAAAGPALDRCTGTRLVDMVEALQSWAVQPGAAWVASLAAAADKKLHQLQPRDLMTLLGALHTWCNRQQSAAAAGATTDAVAAAGYASAAAVGAVAVPTQLLLSILRKVAAAPASYSHEQLCYSVTALGDLGVAAVDQVDQEAVNAVLSELVHSHMSSLTTGHLVNVLTALGSGGLGVTPDKAFMAALQRELQPRLNALTTAEFAALAQAVAGFGAQLERDTLDAYLTVLQPRLVELTLVDQVLLLQGLGALGQKPRSTILGQLLTVVKQGLTTYSRDQLLVVLRALSQLQLSAEDTQGVRLTVAAAVPTPKDVLGTLLQQLTPHLAAATAAELARVLQQLGALRYSPAADWVAVALEGAEGKLQAAGDNQVLVDFLSAVAALGTPTPQGLITTLTATLRGNPAALTAPQLAAAMTALNRLAVAVDPVLLSTYFDRAEAVAGDATAAEMAFVLQSLVAAGPAAAPSADWLQRYLAAAESKLVNADPAALAGMVWAAAKLGGQPSSGWLTAAVSRGRQLLGSNYMEAGKYLDDSFVQPFDLLQLSDAVWGLVKLGAERKPLQPLTNMLVSKSHERLSQLSVSQLVGVTWAVSKCGVALTQKWVNQLGAALSGHITQLTHAEITDLLTALTWQCGCAAGAAAADADSSSSSSSMGSSSSSSSSSMGSCAGSTTSCPEELLAAVAAQVNSRLDGLTNADMALTVHLLAHHDTLGVVTSTAVLQRYCRDAAALWSNQSNPGLTGVVVVEAAAAVATLLQMEGGSTSGLVLAVQDTWLLEWLQQWATAVQPSLVDASAAVACRAAWAAATVQLNPGVDWVNACANAALTAVSDSSSSFSQKDTATAAAAGPMLDPGLLTDGVWGLQQLGYSLQRPQLQRLSQSLTRRVANLKLRQIQRLMDVLTAVKAADDSYKPPGLLVEELSKAVSNRVTELTKTNIADFVWAVARIGLQLYPATLREICKRLYGQRESATAIDLVKGFWATSQLGFSWLPPQLEDFDQRTAPLLTSLTGGQVVLLLEAFKMNRYSPSQAWLQQLAGQPVEAVAPLPTQEVLQLATSLTGPEVAVPAVNITWLPAWAEGLGQSQLQGLTEEQVGSLVALVAAASRPPSSSSSSQYAPSAQLLGLLGLQLARCASQLSAAGVVKVVNALGSWRYNPFDQSVLPALAARAADKLPVLNAGQTAQLLVNFSVLGHRVGEPLRSKLLVKLSAAAATTPAAALGDASDMARLVEALVTSCEQPDADLVSSLVKQLPPALTGVDPLALVGLVRAAAASAAGSGIRTWALDAVNLRLAVSRQLSRLPPAELAQACRSLQLLQLPADDATATALVNDSQQRLLTMAAASSASSGSSSSSSSSSGYSPAAPGALTADCMAAVADYLISSRKRPNDGWLTSFQLQLQAMLQQQQYSTAAVQAGRGAVDSNTTTTTSSSSTSSSSSSSTPYCWSGDNLARTLRALSAWGVKSNSDFNSAALVASQQLLPAMGCEGLGALLLGFSGLGAKPSREWMEAWCVAVQLQLETLTSSTSTRSTSRTSTGTGSTDSSDSSSSRTAQAVTSLGPAVARANHRPAANWWSTYLKAVGAQLPAATASDLANVCQALDSCGQTPDAAWLTAVNTRLTRVPAGRDRDLALAWLTKLQTRAVR